MNQYFARTVSLSVALCLIHLLSDSAVCAESVEVQTVHVGLAGHVQLGSWTPVVASVRSAADKEVAVELVVTAPDVDGQLVTLTGARTQLQAGETAQLTTRYMPGRAHGEVRVQVLCDGTVTYDSRLRPTPATSTGEAMAANANGPGNVNGPLYVAHRQDKPFWILGGLPGTLFGPTFEETSAETSEGTEPAESAGEISPQLIELSAASFPRQAIDLDAVDVIVLAGRGSSGGSSGNFLSLLTAEQQGALRDWVEIRGGHLVLSMGGAASDLENSPLGQWLKLPIQSATTLRQLDGLESYSPYPAALVVPGTVESLRLGPVNGEVLARSLDGPLLVQQTLGFGRSTFLAVDLDRAPLATWEGTGRLIQKMVSPLRDQVRAVRIQGAQLAKSTVNDLSSQLYAALEIFPGVVRLSLWSVLGLMAVYLLLVGPLDYLIVHRWLKKPHFTWVTLLIWVGLGSLLIISASNSLNGRTQQATQLEVIDLDLQSGRMRGHSWLTVYSPQSKLARIELDRPAAGWPEGSQTLTGGPHISWAAPAENRIGGLYREGGSHWTQRAYRGGAHGPSADVLSTGGPPAAGSAPTQAAAGDTRADAPPAESASPSKMTAFDDVPLQVWSTARFQSEWSGVSDTLVEAQLASSEVGRLNGSLEHRLPGNLTDTVLAYANRVYIPIVRRGGGQNSGELRPNFVWEIGGGQPVEQRELRSFLTQVYVKEVRREGQSNTSPELLNLQTPYNPGRYDTNYILQMLTFHLAAGGRDYTGMRHDVLGHCDMSGHLRAGRAILYGRLQQSSATWKVDRETVTPVKGETFIRIVLPVKRDSDAEVRPVLKPDEGIPHSG